VSIERIKALEAQLTEASRKEHVAVEACDALSELADKQTGEMTVEADEAVLVMGRLWRSLSAKAEALRVELKAARGW
jgi:hypothetical protein